MLRLIAGFLVLGLALTQTQAVSAPKPGKTQGVAGPRVAAPEALLPQNHWAYDALTMCAQSGFATGFPDNTFSGKRLVSRSDFATATRIVLLEAAEVIELGSDSFELRCRKALEKLAEEFSPELSSAGMPETEVESRLRAYLEFCRRPRPQGIWVPGLPSRWDRRITPVDRGAQEEGARMAAAEWTRGEVILYSPDPVHRELPGVTDPLPVRHLPEVFRQPRLREVIAGHNRAVWLRLRNGDRPPGNRLAWLTQIVDLEQAWRRRGKTYRFPRAFGAGVVTADNRYSFTLFMRNPPQICGLVSHTLELPGPISHGGPFHRPVAVGFERNVRLALGPEGSGTVLVRSEQQLSQNRWQVRLRAIDIRTGWVLNSASG